MDWLTYQEILDSPYKFTAQEILSHVGSGRLLFFDKPEPFILPTDRPVFKNRPDRDRLDHLALQAFRVCTIEGKCDSSSEAQIAVLLTRADRRLLCGILPESLFLKSQVDSLVSPVAEVHDREPAQAKKGAGKKATALTKQAQKRLEEIVPVVKNFCQTLSASIKQEHGTVTHAEAKDWQKEALTLAEEQGAWNEVVKPEDVQAVDFAAHAVSEHKERLKSRLAQLVLAREGFGTKSQKALNKFFR
ncbi:MAG: hypothetical protein ACP5SH_00475 [Syntrophobacteraceae bacterium]